MTPQPVRKVRRAVLTSACIVAGAFPCAAQQPNPAPRFRDLDSLQWRPAGAGVETAIVDGNPQSPGDFSIAMRFKAGGLILPHWHPGETRLVVVRGEVRVGFGDEADTLQARVVQPGGFAAIPATAHHFEAGKTDALVILSGPGPLRTTFVHPQKTNEDPHRPAEVRP